MEKTIVEVERIAVSAKDLVRGDVIYLSTKSDATPYEVLDCGEPFILIENKKNHFASLYRVVTHIYKNL